MNPRTTAALAAALLLPALAVAPQAALAQTPGEPQPSKLFLSAVGEVSAAPDMASVTAGVVAEAATASAAMADQRERMTAVMAALEAAGVPATDIQTTSLELSPVYAPVDYDRGAPQPQPQRITGYRAANRVTVIAHDLTKVGPTLDALVEAGANDISNITFDIEESDALLDQARLDAVAKLRARATLYAEAAGVRIGRILELSEQQNFYPAARMEMARPLAADASTPVSGGELTLSVTVNATFEIDQ
jgi:uncharacterized protein YggE